MKCAACGQSDEDARNLCGHLANDPRVTPEVRLAILRQSLFQQPAKPQPPAAEEQS